ncbi:MAG: short-chain dehydrogenase [Deltaproteobacteria bacterium]|nr:short-chain dehydrogenase [Deltaproteobacteria bacterium]
MEIKAKRAIVLGGTAGIGLAAAHQLMDGGAEVIAASRTATQRKAAHETLGEGATLRDIDVLDRNHLSGFFAEFAPFDILVCSATGGGRAIGPFLEMDLDGFQGSFQKLWGYTNAVRLGAEHMHQDGTIVLVSGYPARKASPGMSAISAVGNAVEGFVRAIAPEIAPRRINVVSPGAIATEMFAMDPVTRDETLARMTKDMLIPRAGTSDEVAQAILFLIQNDFVTGTTVDVDGGALLP